MGWTVLPSRSSAARRWLLALLAALGPACASAQQDRGINEWLMRMQQASQLRSYVGTFVVSSGGGALSSARIWHAGDARQQVERVEVLTGAPRATFRRNDEVLTFLPDHRLVRAERRESIGLFPNLLKSTDTSIPEFYAARGMGTERVAGFEADVVQLAPKDALRFGYRVWSEKRTGLVVKLQTLDGEGNVLEQVAFSELKLDTPVRVDALLRMMRPPQGWRVERAEAIKTSPAAEGWTLRSAVPGFVPMNCYKRPAPAGAGADGMQWIFSDGLASVSLFVEPFDAERHGREGVSAAGATQTLTRHVQRWWITAVGEVPPQTLQAFAQSLERRQ